MKRAVRVFNVEHIKELEFAAVYYVGLDRLTKLKPDLFGKYLYVAVRPVFVAWPATKPFQLCWSLLGINSLPNGRFRNHASVTGDEQGWRSCSH